MQRATCNLDYLLHLTKKKDTFFFLQMFVIDMEGSTSTFECSIIHFTKTETGSISLTAKNLSRNKSIEKE